MMFLAGFDDRPVNEEYNKSIGALNRRTELKIIDAGKCGFDSIIKRVDKVFPKEKLG